MQSNFKEIVLNLLNQYPNFKKKYETLQIVSYVDKFLQNKNIPKKYNINFWNNEIKITINDSILATEIKLYEIEMLDFLKEKLPNIQIKKIFIK